MDEVNIAIVIILCLIGVYLIALLRQTKAELLAMRKKLESLEIKDDGIKG